MVESRIEWAFGEHIDAKDETNYWRNAEITKVKSLTNILFNGIGRSLIKDSPYPLLMFRP